MGGHAAVHEAGRGGRIRKRKGKYEHVSNTWRRVRRTRKGCAPPCVRLSARVRNTKVASSGGNYAYSGELGGRKK